MDWAKAKNILIVAFIIANLFLGYNVIKDLRANNDVYMIDDERINDVKEILKENNIIVKAEIPKEVSQFPKLTFEYESYDREDIEERFPEFTSVDENYIKYYKEDETVRVPSHKKSITYTRRVRSLASGEIDEKKAEEIALAFIKKHGFEDDKIELWNIQEKGGRYEIEYKQKHEDMILSDGYMNVTIRNGEITWFERRWLKPIDAKSFNKRTIPATKALLLSLGELEKKKTLEDSEVIITDIDLVYVIDNYEITEFSDEEWHESSEKDPSLYWRIRLEDKSYVDEAAEVY